MSYSVEFAKSARAKCKKCKEPIQKGDVKIVTEVEGERFTTSVSHHTQCFALPRKFASGPEALTPAAFVEDILEDKTGGDILPAQAERIATELHATASHTKQKRTSQTSAASRGGGATTDEASPLAGWKRAYEASQSSAAAHAASTAPSAKKPKSTVVVIELDSDSDDAAKPPSTSHTANGDSEIVRWYGTYHKFKNDQLKDMLRWNRQVQTPPTKDMLLYKVIDGSVHGRLARCVLCGGGRLKLVPQKGVMTVVCSGGFDEDTQRRVECAFTCTPVAAPRLQPWYDREPNEEQQEEMDRLDTDAKSGVASTVAGTTALDDVAVLQTAAAALVWNLQSRDGLRAAAADMVALLHQHTGPRTVDLPLDEDDPTQVALTVLPKIGQTIAAHRTKSAAELVPLLVEQFGFQQDKQAKADRRQAALATVVACPDNAALVNAFAELSDLYFKTGNGNAGVSYKKVVAALASYPHAITEANAKGLGGGKTKVANIGKSSAEKIYEFVTTGTLQKLEEKRADAS